MSSPAKTFLVVDDNADSRFLLVKTLLRKFPEAVIRECQESVDAIEIARSGALSAIIAHRAADLDGITLIRELRSANSTVIILMVSGLDRTESAIRAGATCFLNYDEWLRVGSLVTDLLARAQAINGFEAVPSWRSVPPLSARTEAPGVLNPAGETDYRAG